MGQKVHPKGLRLGISTNHVARWFANKNYCEMLREDIFIRNFLKKKLQNAGISSLEIERTANRIRVIINTAKPGVVIGRSGAGIDKLRDELEKQLEKKQFLTTRAAKREIYLGAQEIFNPELSAQLVAENIASQLVKRISFRKAVKQAINRVLRAGAKGIKVRVGGRLQGAEIARKERYIVGRVPLHTLRADIDYGVAEALTTYGQIGVKVWIYKGDVV